MDLHAQPRKEQVGAGTHSPILPADALRRQALAPTSQNFTLCARRWYDLECSGLSVKIHFGGCAKGKGSCHPKVFGDAAEATGYARGKVNAQGKKGFAVVEASKRPAA